MSQPEAAWRLSFPMYNLTPALALAWNALAQQVADGLRQGGWHAAMQVVPAQGELLHWWRRNDLLLSQTCGYPLATALREDVRVLAALAFALPGCDGIRYRSAIVVPESGVRHLQDLRGTVAAINQWDSHSGMNALRHTVAPLARGGRFFSEVVESGSHMASLALVQAGRAAVAAIDSVTFGLAAIHAPRCVAGVRVLQYSVDAPGLPLIAARALSEPQAAALRAQLLALPSRAPALLAALSIEAVQPVTLATYAPILQQERFAAELGYPTLA